MVSNDIRFTLPPLDHPNKLSVIKALDDERKYITNPVWLDGKFTTTLQRLHLESIVIQNPNDNRYVRIILTKNKHKVKKDASPVEEFILQCFEYEDNYKENKKKIRKQRHAGWLL